MSSADMLPVPVLKRKSLTKDIVLVSSKKISNTKTNSPRPSKKQQKYQIDFPIYDAEYEEYGEADESPKKSEFRKAPPRNALDLGLAKRSKSLEKRRSSEPPAIAAISKQKQKTKSELTDFNSARPSQQARKDVNDDWLIDEMFDGVIKVANTVGNVGKIAGKVGKFAAKAGFDAAKTGIRAAGELTNEFERTPIAKNLQRNAEAEYRHMRSAGRRARDSIVGGGVVQTGTKTATNDGASATNPHNPHGITARCERWIYGHCNVFFINMVGGLRKNRLLAC